MNLDDDLESLFHGTPLLSAVARACWQVTPLGGITNRSYRLRAEGRDLVLRLPGAGASRYLDREAAVDNARKVAALDLAPKVLASDPASGWYITAFETGGRPLTAVEFGRREVLQEVVQLLTRLHRSDIRFPSQQNLFQAIDLYLELAPTEKMMRLRRRLDPVETALKRNRMMLAPCHIDPSPANFLRCADGRLLLLDWEFAAMEEPIWDLAAVALEAGLDDATIHEAIEPVVGRTQIPRFELYKTTLNLVAASWCEAEIRAGNDARDLIGLREQAIARLERRLADPRHLIWLDQASI